MIWEWKVLRWAEDRNLVEGSDPARQMRKLLEEVGELAGAIATDDKEEMQDAIGDCCVVLRIMAAQAGLPWQACLDHAWEQIKDRTGRMQDGVFVKD